MSLDESDSNIYGFCIDGKLMDEIVGMVKSLPNGMLFSTEKIEGRIEYLLGLGTLFEVSPGKFKTV